VPIALAIAGANRNDHLLLQETIESLSIARPKPTSESPQGMCLDKGYDYPVVYRLLGAAHFTPHVRSRGEEVKSIKDFPGFKARRWVVERTHSWMNRFRRILVRWEKRPDTYLAMLHFACALITWGASGRLR
jgi:putative transposase